MKLNSRLVGQLVERACLVQSKPADPGAPQRGQVTADRQRGAEIAGQGADVGSGGTVDLDVDVDQVVVAAYGQHLEPVDAHRPRGQFDGCPSRASR